MPPDFNVLVVYNEPQTNTQGVSAESDAGILDEVRAVSDALESLGYVFRLAGIHALDELRRCLAAASEQVVMNLVEYLPPDIQDASLVPSVCRAFGKTCTGNESLALMLGLDKWRAKALFQHAGLLTPKGVEIQPGQPIPYKSLPPGPFIVKPVATDASEGIDDHSIVQQADEILEAAVRRIHTEFRQAALVEQYIGERELNVSLLQVGTEVQVLPLAEIDFSALQNKPHIVSYAAKWLADSFEYQHTPRLLPAPLPDEVAQTVREAALGAWNALGCQDYARVDMRLDRQGSPWVIEVNPNPDISPDAGYTAALQAAGISYAQFIDILLSNAWRRHHQLPGVTLDLAIPGAHPSRVIRQAVEGDRLAVQAMLEHNPFFRDDEVPVAMEVLDDALAQDDHGTYNSYVIEEHGVVQGWICWGLTPCTLGTYDIYWLVVNPARKSSGLGSALLAFAEQQIRAAGGRLAVIETSGSDLYYPTRQFYLKRGYREQSRLADFYAPGDDKVIYTKAITRE